MPAQSGASSGSAGREGNEGAHLALGRAGEEAAAALLERNGFRILDRNWRPAGARRGLELDIVADLHGTLVFVEVKTRRVTGGADAVGNDERASSARPERTGGCCGERGIADARREGFPVHAGFTGHRRGGSARKHEGVPVYAGFTPGKRKRFTEAARRWLSAHAAWSRPCRFDAILVERRADGTLYAEQHADVIELGDTLGDGNPYWQPW